MKEKRDNYTCASCSFECPNSIFTDETYDIASEMSCERVNCDKCWLNDKKCSTCLFEGNDSGICNECERGGI